MTFIWVYHHTGLVTLPIRLKTTTYKRHVRTPGQTQKDTIEAVAWNIHQYPISSVSKGIRVLYSSLRDVSPNTIVTSSFSASQAFDAVVAVPRKCELHERLQILACDLY